MFLTDNSATSRHLSRTAQPTPPPLSAPPRHVTEQPSHRGRPSTHCAAQSGLYPVYRQAAITPAVWSSPHSPAVRAGQASRHSLRGDVEPDISVLPQHVKHGAHGCPLLPFPPATPRAAVATGALPRAPAALGIGYRPGGGGARSPVPPRTPWGGGRRCAGAFWRERRVWALCEGRPGASGHWVRLFLVP